MSNVNSVQYRYAMIHTAFFLFLQTLLSVYHIMLLAICTTEVTNQIKKKTKKGVPVRKYLERLPSLHDIDLFSLKSNSDY